MYKKLFTLSERSTKLIEKLKLREVEDAVTLQFPIFGLDFDRGMEIERPCSVLDLRNVNLGLPPSNLLD